MAVVSVGELPVARFTQVAMALAVTVFGIRFVGINWENGQKVFLTIVLIVGVMLLGRGLRALLGFLRRSSRDLQTLFWSRQIVNLATVLIVILGLMSIWFDDPTRLATALGLITAGLAFALQRVIASMAGYVVILRGNNFSIGDRITMGGVRGDVVGLGFIQTTILEMGQPPAAQGGDPAIWVRSRQYTGRLVTVSNDKIFNEPIYNYTREFPYIWEEMVLPISYTADRQRAEAILLEVATKHTGELQETAPSSASKLEHRYSIRLGSLEPRVYFRLTDNWLELTVRFLAEVRGVRDLKDAMSRDIIASFDDAGIEIASATFEIVKIPQFSIAPAD